MIETTARSFLFRTLIALAGVTLAGCHEDEPAAPGPAAEIGEVGLELNLGGGVNLAAFDYAITGPNAFRKSGVINVAGTDRLVAVISPLPVGSGYTIVVSNPGGNGVPACTGMATFDVNPRGTTLVVLRLQCLEPSRHGSLQIDGTVNVCPVIDGISANPARAFVGSTIALSAAAHDRDARPAALAYAWTTTAGMIGNPTSAEATFTCPDVGSVAITLQVTDGDCSDRVAITVTCVPPAGPPALVRINEIESNGGTPGDWVELYNAGASAADVSGWLFKDNDDTRTFALPAGTTIPPGGFLVLDEATFGFGLGAMDSARLFAAGGATLVDAHTWIAHAPTSYARCPDGTGAFATATTVTKGAANDCTPAPTPDSAADAGAPDAAPVPSLVINEVESNGGTPGDWVEILNTGASSVDLSGFVFRDNDDSRGYTIPAGTTLAAGGYLVLEEAAFGFGLGGADSARLFAAGGTTVISGHSWTAHAMVTYGRCPNGSGALVENPVASKGAANVCSAPDAGASDTGTPDAGSPDGAVAREPWPGRDQVVTVDTLNQFGDNLSGLTYQPAAGSAPAVLWAALNSPSLVYRLLWNGSSFAFDTADDWAAGKAIRYPSGTGNPDFEGLTKAEWDAPFVYAATERNNDASSVSRLSILRVDTSAAGAVLTATHEWNLNGDLPVVGPNLGLEAITFVPDSYLVGSGFRDERTGALYDPATYPAHGSGLFFTGVEGSGIIYAYALDHAGGTFARVATIASGHPGVMGLEFDRDAGALWAHCDNTCANTSNLLGVVGGRFTVRRSLARPSSLPDSNNEGIAIAPDSACEGGMKAIFWTDDSHFAGHALRRDAIPCGPLF